MNATIKDPLGFYLSKPKTHIYIYIYIYIYMYNKVNVHDSEKKREEKQVKKRVTLEFGGFRKEILYPQIQGVTAALCDRPNREMKLPSSGKTWRRPKADFVLSGA
jgi:hypothetical protein